jgi:hypothetical protein
MAIWQYNFFIIPKDSFKTDEKLQFLKHDEDGFDDAILWRDFPTSVYEFQSLEAVLPRKESWSKDIFLLGDIESNCIEVYFDEGWVTSVSLRVDFTSDYLSILSTVVEFCVMKGFSLLDEDLTLLQLNSITLERVIKTSEQFVNYQKLMNKGEG